MTKHRRRQRNLQPTPTAMSNNEEEKEKAVSWLASLLTGWGIKESWAQYIAAAVVGAVAAVLVMAQGSCTATATQSADGSWTYSGEGVAPIIRELDGEEK